MYLKVNLVVPWHAGVTVKDQQMRAVGPALVGIARRLHQTGRQRGGAALVLDFELQHHLLHRPQKALAAARWPGLAYLSKPSPGLSQPAVNLLILLILLTRHQRHLMRHRLTGNAP